MYYLRGSHEKQLVRISAHIVTRRYAKCERDPPTRKREISRTNACIIVGTVNGELRNDCEQIVRVVDDLRGRESRHDAATSPKEQ